MNRIGLLLYRPQASPLHATRAGVAALWGLALIATSLLLYHPVALAVLALAVLAAGWGAGVGRALLLALRTAAIVAIPIVLINVLVSREGLTVFARLGDLGPFGQGDLTVEALVYGAVIALKVTVLILITALCSLAIDPDALLRICRRLSFRSAVTASLAVRMIPVLAADAQRIAEAQRTRPAGPTERRSFEGARARVALIGAMLTGSLDRAMDVAATLELRGFAAAPRAPRLSRPWSRHDLAFAASAAAILALALLASIGGVASFTAYPLVHAPISLGSVRALRSACARDPPPVRRSPGDRAMNVLSFRDVTYHYPDAGPPALDDVSFEVAAGEFCLLAGLSGHGKSTLLRAACGLVPHFHGGCFAGRVQLAGLDTREHGPAHLGTLAGALFQDPESQLVMSSVRAELALALESRAQTAGAVARGVEEVALALGIDHLLDRPTRTLSGGEAQRVALGAALSGRPPVLLLDEPTSQLDPVAGDELIGLLRRLNQEWDVTILLAEHRLERCLPSADRVLALRDGRLVHDGSPESFLGWAVREEPALQTPGARLFALAGFAPPPVGVKQARASLRARRLLSSESVSSPAPPAALHINMGNRRQGAPSSALVRPRAPLRRCECEVCGTSSTAAPRSCAAPSCGCNQAKASP